MSDENIKNLKEALAYSPNNVPLRLHLAESLLQYNRLEEAEKEFHAVLEINICLSARLPI